MTVIKRNGSEVTFDITKIIAAITKANESVDESIRMTPMQIQRIAESVEFSCLKMNRSPSVEEIQDLVEYQIMAHGAFEVAKNYVTYRYTRSLVRRSNTTDEKILSLIECCNEEAKQENANKNPVVNSTQRDYMAGEVSRDITERILLPQEIVEAHREGIIHFHDADYYAQHMHNCDLVNLEDMLQNGTVITGTLIERPHSFATACNIATQIVAQVASNQYGGQSISLTHLAPFVEVSRQKIRKIVEAEMASIGADPGAEKITELVETRLREEIRRGVQTIQYQVVTLLTTNGQAPFITVFMYLGEAENEREKKDLAMIIEEMLLQRYQGVKNEDGVWVTPAFPKLIYENSLSLLLAETPHTIERADTWNFPYGMQERFSVGIPVQMLSNRPDVRSAERSLEAAFYVTNQARSAFYPSIVLSGSAGWTNSAGSMIVNPGKFIATAIGSLTQPLFNRGTNIARLKIAKAQQEEAKLGFQQTLLNAGSEVNEALVKYQTAKEKAAYYDKQIMSLNKAFESTSLLMQHGNTTYLEVLTAQQTLLSAQLNQVANRFAEIQGVINLYQALGGGRD